MGIFWTLRAHTCDTTTCNFRTTGLLVDERMRSVLLPAFGRRDLERDLLELVHGLLDLGLGLLRARLEREADGGGGGAVGWRAARLLAEHIGLLLPLLLGVVLLGRQKGRHVLDDVAQRA